MRYLAFFILALHGLFADLRVTLEDLGLPFIPDGKVALMPPNYSGLKVRSFQRTEDDPATAYMGGFLQVEAARPDSFWIYSTQGLERNFPAGQSVELRWDKENLEQGLEALSLASNLGAYRVPYGCKLVESHGQTIVDLREGAFVPFPKAVQRGLLSEDVELVVQGSVQLVFPYKPSCLPKNIVFMVEMRHQPYPEDDQQLMTIKWNGISIQSYHLDPQGAHRSYAVSLGSSSLDVDNVLTLHFETKGPQVIELKKSCQVIENGRAPVEVGSIVNFAYQGGDACFVKIHESSKLEFALSLVELLGQIRGKGIRFSTSSSSESRLFLGVPEAFPSLNLPLKKSGAFRILDPLSGESLFQSQGREGEACLQVTEDEYGRPSMAVHSRVSWLKGLSPAKVRALKGDLVLYRDGQWFAGSTDAKILVEYPGDIAVEELWLQNRWALLVILGLFATAFMTYVWKRLTI